MVFPTTMFWPAAKYVSLMPSFRGLLEVDLCR